MSPDGALTLSLSPKGWRGIWNGDIFVFLMVPPPAENGIYSENAAAALEILCFALDAIETPG